MVFSQEPSQHFDVAVAQLAQHPADSLVNEVVFVVQQNHRDVLRHTKVVGTDVGKRKHHGHAALPQHLAASKVENQRFARMLH